MTSPRKSPASSPTQQKVLGDALFYEEVNNLKKYGYRKKVAKYMQASEKIYNEERNRQRKGLYQEVVALGCSGMRMAEPPLPFTSTSRNSDRSMRFSSQMKRICEQGDELKTEMNRFVPILEKPDSLERFEDLVGLSHLFSSYGVEYPWNKFSFIISWKLNETFLGAPTSV